MDVDKIIKHKVQLLAFFKKLEWLIDYFSKMTKTWTGH